MTIKIEYPLTVYFVDDEYGTGALQEVLLQAPHNYDTHVIKSNKLIWRLGDGQSRIFFLKKKDARKRGLQIARTRISILVEQIRKLRIVVKEILKK